MSHTQPLVMKGAGEAIPRSCRRGWVPAASAASARRHTAADTAVAPARPPVKTQLMSSSPPQHPKQMSSTTRSLLDPHSGAAPTELLVLGRANWRAATQGTCAQATSEGTSKGTRAYSRGLDPYRHAASVGNTERGLEGWSRCWGRGGRSGPEECTRSLTSRTSGTPGCPGSRWG